MIDNHYFKKFLQTITDEILIEYRSRSGGCLVQRIIAADSESIYWDKFINNSLEDNIDPLYWPNKGFRPQIPHSVTPENQVKYTCHTGGSMLHTGEQKELIGILTLRRQAKKANKKLLLRSHHQLRKYNKNMTIVNIVGNKQQLGRKIQKSEEFFKPVEEHNTHNLNINKLVSEDYNLFLNEYTNLCKFLDIKMNITIVKNFIDIWRIKQKA